MKRLILLCAFLLLGLFGYLVAWNWAVWSVTATDLNGPGEDAQKIRGRHLIVLIAPEKLPLEEHRGIMPWIFEEMNARLGVVFLIWSTLGFGLYLLSTRVEKRQIGTTK